LEISDLPETYRERLNELFKIKEKWTFREFKIFFEDLNISNLEEKLGSCLRIISEPNPFDSKRQINFYYQKYKLY
jgi:hypothetical protein